MIQVYKLFFLFVIALLTIGFASNRQTRFSKDVKTKYNSSDETRVISYLPYYSISKVSSEIFSHLTHVNYFAIGTNSSGELGRINGSGVFTSLDDIPQMGNDLDTLIKWRGDFNTKVFVVFGGWVQSDYFDEMAANATARANFIKNVKKLLIDNKLDGADIDWEGYNGAVVDSDYKKLLEEMNQAFAGTNLGLSVAIGKTHTSLADEFMESNVEHIGLMTYGRVFDDGMQVSLNQLEGYVNKWIAAGATKEKLVVGVPFYGRTPADGSAVTYREIISEYNPANFVNSIQHNNKTYYYNGIDAIKAKASYVKEEELKGIMIWEEGQDVAIDNEKSLLKAISQVLPVDVAASVNDEPTVPNNEVQDINVYPSPFQEKLNVHVNVQSGSSLCFSVFDLNGSVVYYLQEYANSKQTFQLNLEELPKGIYVLKMSSEHQNKLLKIIKQ